MKAYNKSIDEKAWRVTFALGEDYSNAKLVSKVLKFLLKRFSIKVTVIEEAKDIESLEINELIGSLQTFEMNLKDVKHNKTKEDQYNAFTASTIDDGDSDSDSNFGSGEEFLKTYKEILGEWR
ncbi:molybdate transporter 1-like [Gossypium australe]|uniref:Molybdate transporter 1-like n=1 Tax=Gossypium australe TaxID=47621 RepID=A0A5B6W6D9_9ROSI|nr:molybdate transporter 1-like [Gossypium australe]